MTPAADDIMTFVIDMRTMTFEILNIHPCEHVAHLIYLHDISSSLCLIYIYVPIIAGLKYV